MPKTAKTKALVIVESPAKAKTINKYLGPGFEVKASFGHIRDLPERGLSVDIEKNFEPTYDVPANKKKTVAALKAAAKKCDTLYLATDLDREGEAIAWHLAEILRMPPDQTWRVVFNSITKKAIQDAFAQPGRLDMNRVMAQQARRILDRIVGYQISPLLWKKVARGLSAGRVQSVAVRIIVEKEREIRAFIPQEYWLIPAVFSTIKGSTLSRQWQDFVGSGSDPGGPSVEEQNQWMSDHKAFRAELTSVNNEKFHAENQIQAQRIFAALDGAAFFIEDLSVKRVVSRPSSPFITSTLQQAAANRLGFTASRTMVIAQQLYEGIDLGSMGSLGLITYMRTDSTHLSGEALESARHYIASNIGADYVPEKPNFFASKQGAQQAHEAIRPTDPDLTPDQIRNFLTEEQFKLYDLIWRRFVACQMASAQWDTTSVEILAETSIGPCRYRANGRVLVFDGFTKIWPSRSEGADLPPLRKGDAVFPVSLRPQQHFTKPPARYTEASLVKALEKEGIGRPSTYASIISTIQDRQYVEKIEGKFHATHTGEIVTDKLCEYFPRVMDIAFTRHMEDQLDKIEEQHLDWVRVLQEFYEPFRISLDKATEEMKHAKAETQPSEYSCSKCGKPMVYRFGKNGRFLSCSAYPDCKHAERCDREGKILGDEKTDHVCTTCGKPMVIRTGRFGRFLSCSGYPECKTIQKIDKEGKILPPKPPAQPTGVRCHKCSQGELVIRQSKRGPFLGCNRFPRCRTIVSMNQLDALKQWQAEGKWPPSSPEQLDQMLGKPEKKPARIGRNSSRKPPPDSEA